MHRVIDVAVIGATGDRLDFEWQTLVHPGARISAGITALTGIDDEMIADAPPFERVAKELRERLAGRVFVAHNVRFDYGFIRREFARMGSEWRSPNLCTVRLSRALYPEMPRHNLDAVMEHHGITVEQRHRAMPDAQVLWQLWRKLRTGLDARAAAGRDRARLAARIAAAAAVRRIWPTICRRSRVCIVCLAPARRAKRCCTSARPTTCANACSTISVPAPADVKSGLAAGVAGSPRRVDRDRRRARRAAAGSARDPRTPAGVQPPVAQRR